MTAAERFSMEEWSLESAVELFFQDGFKDGDLISNDWIAYAIDVPSQRTLTQEELFERFSRIEALKSTLLQDHQVALQNVRGKGYRVVPPAEQARYAAEEAAKYMKKGLRKAEALLNNTRMDSLTDDQKRRHTDTVVRMAALKGMADKGRRDVFKLFSPER